MGGDRARGAAVLKTRVLAACYARLRRLWCRHGELVRVHVDGVWYFVCDCGYRRPVMRRTPQERAARGRGMWMS